jgi:serine/threonine-protein kinase
MNEGGSGSRLGTTVLVAALVSAAVTLLVQVIVVPRLPVQAVEVPHLIGLQPDQARAILEQRGLLLLIDGERETDKVAIGALAEQRPLAGSRLRRGDEVHATVGRSAPKVKVPEVAGMSVEAARAALAEAKLNAGRTVEEAAENAPSGQVLRAEPKPGSEVRQGTNVDLVVSAGKTAKPVPSVVGKSLRSAKKLLTEAGFEVGTTKYSYNEDYDEGIILKQNPPSGAQASPGVKVDLVVNE